MASATTYSETYSVVDIETVFKSFGAELRMIAQSSTTITTQRAEEYIYDCEYLAKKGYLKSVDLTLFDENQEEIRAVTYTVNTSSGELTSSRPGGVMWPRTPDGSFRIVLSYTPDWHAMPDDDQARVKRSLKRNWVPTGADTSHKSLKKGEGRAFISNGYSVERQDYSK